MLGSQVALSPAEDRWASGMNIHISQISEEDGLSVKHTYKEGELKLRGDDSRLIGPTSVEARATREGHRVKLAGNVQASAEMDCDRCLSALSVLVDQSFDLLYIPPAKTASAQEEKELGYDDLSIAFYQDQVIDIDDLAREQIELALPMSRLCGDACRGLCPECGVNLNETECACSVEQVDPRWAALKEFKTGN
jgi:uncharacterized protein